MLKPRDDDLVILLDIAPTPTLGDQVDAFGSAANKNNLARGRRIQKTAYFFPRPFVCIRGPRSQSMSGAMNIRIFVPVKRRDAIDDGVGFLGGGSIVQPHQRPPVHLLLQNREITADDVWVKWSRRQTHVRHYIGTKLERLGAQWRRGRYRSLLVIRKIGRRPGDCRSRSRMWECLKMGGRR